MISNNYVEPTNPFDVILPGDPGYVEPTKSNYVEPTSDRHSTKGFTVRVEPTTREQIRRLSERTGFSTNDIIKACIKRAMPYLEDKF